MGRVLEMWVDDRTLATALDVLTNEHDRLSRTLDVTDGKAREHARQVELAWKRLYEARRTASIHIAGWS